MRKILIAESNSGHGQQLGRSLRRAGQAGRSRGDVCTNTRRKEKVLGAKHTSILNIVNNLGILNADQDKLAEAHDASSVSSYFALVLKQRCQLIDAGKC